MAGVRRQRALDRQLTVCRVLVTRVGLELDRCALVLAQRGGVERVKIADDHVWPEAKSQGGFRSAVGSHHERVLELRQARL